MEGQHRRRRWKKKRSKAWIGAILLIAVFTVLGIMKFRQTHFEFGTYIHGTNCSWLSVTRAKEKIEENLKQQQINFLFEGENEHATGAQLGMYLKDTEELQAILQEQRQNKQEVNNPTLEHSISVEEETVKEYLQLLPELQEENMHSPQNAYMKIGTNHLIEIIPAVSGNEIQLEDAYLLTLKALQGGMHTIDMKEVTYLEPEITMLLLQDEANRINGILCSQLQIQLIDGSICTLDIGTMKNWIYQEENGNYNIEIDENVKNFVEKLSQKVEEVNTTVKFHATELEEISVPVQKSARTKLDKEETAELIKSSLGNSNSEKILPAYTQVVTLDSVDSYVEIDLTRQRVWLYQNGECIENAPCVTGNVKSGHSTPTGIYYLMYKAKNATLRGYNNDGSRYTSFVNYWMPFNGGIGMHDALWRYKTVNGKKVAQFGGEIYKTNGSHGCVNLPIEAAKIIYENLDGTMPIIVYQS